MNSVWKSPVLYFGVLLLAAIAAAMMAPFIINWDSYKPDLQSFGQKLTGREVAIDGPVAVRLFPWPRLEAENVRIANWPPTGEDSFATADKITVRVTLAGLFRGELQVEEIELDKPVFSLLRNPDQSTNWQFEPDGDLRASALLEQVKLDKITVRDGIVRYAEPSRQLSATIEAISGSLAAPSIAGPWKMRGTGRYLGFDGSIAVSTSEYKSGEPLKFGFKIYPNDIWMPAFSFDGKSEGGKLVGGLRIDPSPETDQKGSREGKFRPLTMQSEVVSDFDEVNLRKIRITPTDTNDGSTLIEGEATIKLRSGVDADFKLSSPRLNLDALLGAQSLEAWRVGGAAGFLNTVVKSFPENVRVKLNLDSNVVTLAQETLENVTLIAEAERNAIRIRKLLSSLPGQSRVLFDGIVFPGETQAEFGGSIAVESNDARALSSWIMPQRKAQFAKYWTGNRGRLKAEALVSFSNQIVGFQTIKYELDGSRGTGDLSFRTGDKPLSSIRLSAESIEIDSYLRQGISVVGGSGGLTWRDLFEGTTRDEDLTERRFVIDADSLVINGVKSEDIAIDINVGAAGVDIRTLDLGSVGGARILSEGQVVSAATGPAGVISTTFTADDPRGMLRLISIIKDKTDPAWSRYIGKTNLRAKLLVGQGAGENPIGFVVEGELGEAKLRADGVLDKILAANAKIQGNATIDAPDGARIYQLLGVPVQTADAGAGQLKVSVNGSLDRGFDVKSTLSALAAVIDFNGTAKLQGPDLIDIEGPISLVAPDASLWLRGLGLSDGAIARTGNLSAMMTYRGGALSAQSLIGDLGETRFNGTAAVSKDKVVAVDLEFTALNLGSVLASGFMPIGTDAPKLDDSFAAVAPFGIKGEIWLRPQNLTLWDGRVAREAVIGLNFDRDNRQIGVAARDPEGEQFSLDFALKPKGGMFELSASGNFSIPMAQVFAAADTASPLTGAITINGKASGAGRGPYAALADMAGEGTYEWSDARLTSLSPQVLANGLAGVRTGEDLKRVFDGFESGPGFDVDDAKGSFRITSGTAKFDPIKRDVSGSAVDLELGADLADGTVSFATRIALGTPAGLPSASVVFSGPPRDIEKRVMTAELASKLGYAILARDLAELEKAQREQQEIIRREEVQRADDAVRFEAYQAQRAELRLRQRELRVHTAQRAILQAEEKLRFDQLVEDAAAMTKIELRRKMREINVLKDIKLRALLEPPQGNLGTPPGAPQIPDGFQLPQ